jgi:hypothetical protein
MDFWEFVWGALVVFFFAMFLVIFITTVMDVFRSRDIGGGAKALWLIFLVVLPVIGVLIYMIVRGPGMAERHYQTQMANAEAMVAAGGGGSVSPADQLHRAKELLDSGAIDEAEYAKLKAQVLR